MVKKPMKDKPKPTKLEIWKDDHLDSDDDAVFAAWCAGSSNKTPMIVLNLGASLAAAVQNDIDPKELLIENLMHEFGHFLEEMFDKDFDEEFIERVIESYRKKYGR